MASADTVNKAMATLEGRDTIRRRLEKMESEQSLRHFIRAGWKVIEPGVAYKHNWHIDLIAENLQAVDEGQIKRLVLNIPPRAMKSTSVTVMWPTWSWISRPEMSWQFWSYSQDLMVKHSLDRRAIIESEWYQGNWGDIVSLAKDENRKGIFMNSQRGVMDATRAKTGKGGNRMVIDDPVNPEDALSPKSRETANRLYDLTLANRLNDPAEDAIVIVMQRLHEDDLSGHVRDLGFEYVSIPAIAERDTIYSFPISGEEKHVKQGDLMWEERFPPAVLDSYRLTLGTYGFASQYQQSPVPVSGSIFDAKKWGHYRQSELPDSFKRVVAFADTAYEEGELNDFSVIALWGESDRKFYLLDLIRGQLEYPALEQAALEKWSEWRQLPRGWRPSRFVIENKASGAPLRQRLKKNTRIPVEAYNPGARDKVARANAISGYVDAGMLMLPDRPEDALGDIAIGPFVSEHSLFPNAKHDDQVDTTTMAILWFTDEPEKGKSTGHVRVGSTRSKW